MVVENTVLATNGGSYFLLFIFAQKIVAGVVRFAKLYDFILFKPVVTRVKFQRSRKREDH